MTGHKSRGIYIEKSRATGLLMLEEDTQKDSIWTFICLQLNAKYFEIIYSNFNLWVLHTKMIISKGPRDIDTFSIQVPNKKEKYFVIIEMNKYFIRLYKVIAKEN